MMTVFVTMSSNEWPRVLFPVNVLSFQVDDFNNEPRYNTQERGGGFRL